MKFDDFETSLAMVKCLTKFKYLKLDYFFLKKKVQICVDS